MLALHAAALLAQPVDGEQFAIQDQVNHAVLLGLAEDIMQIRCLRGQHRDDLVQVAVAGHAGDAVSRSRAARRCSGETSSP
jgi:hypothetical protein